MTDTKEKILAVALQLFAKDGYEAVSVSKIAEKLGITKGALYKHYENKKDIFNSIVARMSQSDHEIARKYGVPENVFDCAPEQYLPFHNIGFGLQMNLPLIIVRCSH